MQIDEYVEEIKSIRLHIDRLYIYAIERKCGQGKKDIGTIKSYGLSIATEIQNLSIALEEVK